MTSPGFTSGLAPGGPNSFSATRPSDFRPTSTMAYSSVRRRTRPVTTEPSKPVSWPSVSSRRETKSSPLKWSCIGTGGAVRATVADSAMCWLCSVTEGPGGLARAEPLVCAFHGGDTSCPRDAPRGPGSRETRDSCAVADIRREPAKSSMPAAFRRVPDHSYAIATKYLVRTDDRRLLLTRLGNQHAIKRIAVRTIERPGNECMCRSDRQQDEARAENNSLEPCNDRCDFGPLANPVLVGNLPSGDSADHDHVGRIGDGGTGRLRQSSVIGPPPDQRVRVEQEPYSHSPNS